MSLHPHYQSSDGGWPKKKHGVSRVTLHRRQSRKGIPESFLSAALPAARLTSAPYRGIWAAHHSVHYECFKIHKETSEVIARGDVISPAKEKQMEGGSSALMWLLITLHILSQYCYCCQGFIFAAIHLSQLVFRWF